MALLKFCEDELEKAIARGTVDTFHLEFQMDFEQMHESCHAFILTLPPDHKIRCLGCTWLLNGLKTGAPMVTHDIKQTISLTYPLKSVKPNDMVTALVYGYGDRFFIAEKTLMVVLPNEPYISQLRFVSNDNDRVERVCCKMLGAVQNVASAAWIVDGKVIDTQLLAPHDRIRDLVFPKVDSYRVTLSVRTRSGYRFDKTVIHTERAVKSSYNALPNPITTNKYEVLNTIN